MGRSRPDQRQKTAAGAIWRRFCLSTDLGRFHRFEEQVSHYPYSEKIRVNLRNLWMNLSSQHRRITSVHSLSPSVTNAARSQCEGRVRINARKPPLEQSGGGFVYPQIYADFTDSKNRRMPPSSL
ncbi:MAG TPA: hypothetical protein VM940_01440, partial [Chthoniobacterales bacterium]|nr:hypothetical protein [Chthoniobacterales bacterium]